MGTTHSHRAANDVELEIDPVPRAVLLSVLGLIGVATIIATVLLWPNGDAADDLRGSVEFAAPGVTFPDAEVVSVHRESITAELLEGEGEGAEVTVEVPPQIADSGLEAGDRIELVRTPSGEGSDVTFGYFGTDRSADLWLLVALFVAVVLWVARLRGVLALVGLAFSALVVWVFVLPALLTGESPVVVAVTGSVAILYVVLYTTHGFSLRTSAALAGTLGGLAITAAIGRWAVGSAHLAGNSDEGSSVLSTFTDSLSFQGLLVAAMILAGIGVLNDVTITQASAVWELRVASPEMSRTQLFTSAMRIGRDHIASSIYTIVFAYLGTALTVFLVIQLYDRSVYDLLGTEEIATEIVRALSSSIGLVLAVPVTTLIAVVTVRDGGPTREAGRSG